MKKKLLELMHRRGCLKNHGSIMQGLKDNSRSLDFIQNAEEAPKDYLEE
jgi:hypothetical protein